jgi:hypothetical protein
MRGWLVRADVAHAAIAAWYAAAAALAAVFRLEWFLLTTGALTRGELYAVVGGPIGLTLMQAAAVVPALLLSLLPAAVSAKLGSAAGLFAACGSNAAGFPPLQFSAAALAAGVAGGFLFGASHVGVHMITPSTVHVSSAVGSEGAGRGEGRMEQRGLGFRASR